MGQGQTWLKKKKRKSGNTFVTVGIKEPLGPIGRVRFQKLSFENSHDYSLLYIQ
jgi:hypothetical protein